MICDWRFLISPSQPYSKCHPERGCAARPAARGFLRAAGSRRASESKDPAAARSATAINRHFGPKLPWHDSPRCCAWMPQAPDCMLSLPTFPSVAFTPNLPLGRLYSCPSPQSLVLLPFPSLGIKSAGGTTGRCPGGTPASAQHDQVADRGPQRARFWRAGVGEPRGSAGSATI